MLQNPANQPRILGEQDPAQPGTGPAELPDSAGQRLAGDCGVGVPAESQPTGTDDAAGGTTPP